ncbi:DUF294 nucleotidyltransferase-like domain-containing protein [Olivibacter sitiensis]|uniref:DUF294 nucleotidyltransferase-like domain-containing protein n=1 Tax=Olivibacter sitiensis TaxID=376470 RepID=UPI0004007BEE|nr:DUF294 nucleotidyltransferase-like domain-containing protein [Olivibacter sitiensis]
MENNVQFSGVQQLYAKRIKEITYKELVTCLESEPIRQVAHLMAANKVSCIFVKTPGGMIVGYVTDIILRDKVIAVDANVDGPIRNVMNYDLHSIDVGDYVYQALLHMFNHRIRYLLVIDENRYIGFLSRNKLLSEQAQSPLVFIQSVRLAKTVAEMKQKWELVPYFIQQLLQEEVKVSIINELITTISDTIAQNIIELVLKELGEAPVRFVFMVLGSEGRREQTLKTDQDNAIIYEDVEAGKRNGVREYFLQFGQKVSDMLHEVGFVYCTGGYMASNPKWTHSLSHWKQNYYTWMEESQPKTAIQFSTFFDCRYLYGNRMLMEELKEYLDRKLQEPLDKFFVYLAKNALQYEPPSSLFGSIKTMRVDNRDVFDIKKTMTPIVDLVRLYALRNRVFRENTGERMEVLRDMGVFDDGRYKELYQAYYFLMSMRLNKQVTQIIEQKVPPDNYMDIKDITKIEKVTLKEIFKSIENFQTGVRVKFTGNLLG